MARRRLIITSLFLALFVLSAGENQTAIDEDARDDDETGFYINGQCHWLHTVNTPELT
ncbi:MAG: hypothetical protein HND44_19405 [Chloroflexi bacterium]|nr:hypothetical protein [Ardenticatenaceae bacterium]NOG36712.1 hypothetical protein [Chloroflexota bacterium]GIK56777.1 MAG: hypothetical protein BroJett015_24400 [Chloroflexota bacterium]